MRSINSAFYTRMQQDGGMLCELIELETTNVELFWTTCDQEVTYVLSGVPRTYVPFPGMVPGGVEESVDLGVAVIDFVMTNTGGLLRKMLEADEFAKARLVVGRVFVDTPDLGRMPYYEGNIGDFSYDRKEIRGQARNKWKSLAIRWPFYNYHDKCVWRFGSDGCGKNTTSLTIATNSINQLASTTLVIALTSGNLSSYPAGRFDFGRLTVTAGVNSGQVRTIRAHTGDYLGLSHPLAINSFSGMSIAIHPGCRKRLKEDCSQVYSNAENFLGFPWIPIQEQAF